MTRFLTAALLSVSLLSGCTFSSGTEPLKEGECDNSADCPDGFRCMDNGKCKQIACTESSECGVEQYCNEAFSCTDGCAEDSDCYAGDECDTTTNTCVTYGCRDTQLDCSYGELCDTTTETCASDGNDHCSQTCNFFSFNDGCSGNTACYPFASQTCQTSADCPNGQRCDEFSDGRYCHIDYCLYPCRADEEEPRGFRCLEPFTNDRSTYLYGDCPYIISNSD